MNELPIGVVTKKVTIERESHAQPKGANDK